MQIVCIYVDRHVLISVNKYVYMYQFLQVCINVYTHTCCMNVDIFIGRYCMNMYIHSMYVHSQACTSDCKQFSM